MLMSYCSTAESRLRVSKLELHSHVLTTAIADQLKAYYLTECNWWSPEAVILARGTGAVTVSSAKTLANLLGSSPEWFDPAPRLSMATEGGFLGLEVRQWGLLKILRFLGWI